MVGQTTDKKRSLESICGKPPPQTRSLESICGVSPTTDKKNLFDAGGVDAPLVATTAPTPTDDPTLDFFKRGLSASALAELSGADSTTIRKAISGFEPISIALDGKTKLYDPMQVIPHLVVDKRRAELILRKVRRKNLPDWMLQAYWKSKEMERDFLRDSGHLWHSDDIVFLLSSLFKTFKSDLMTWPDYLIKEGIIAKENHGKIADIFEGLARKIHADIISGVERNSAVSYVEKATDSLDTFEIPE